MPLSTQKKALRSIGNWDLFEKIADSGMSTVYKARSNVNGAVVAVKIMPPFRAGNEQAYQRFARECRILSALNDPHIVRATDFGIEGSEPYLVMEFVEGETLGERVAREGSIPEAEAVRLILQVAGALGRAHGRGLVHRNVKPDSILITADGHAKLTDLCLVKEVEAPGGLTRDGTSLGTPNFMAPEQLRNASRATRRCDIYSLAATLYMAVTGEPPYGGCDLVEMWKKKLQSDLLPPKKLIPTLSERTDRAIRRAMSAQPDQRPATCEEFAENLNGGSELEALIGTAEVEKDQTAPELVRLPVPTAAAHGTAHVGASERKETATNSKAAMGPPAEECDDSGSDFLWLVAIALVAAVMAGLFFLSRLVHFGG
jgi:eukaryotic-like serine/threonine-protein kinase